MNPKLRAYLVQEAGMKADVSEADAVRYWQSLTGDIRTKADEIARQAEPPAPAPVAAAAPAAQPAAPAARSESEIRADERKRMTAIDRLAKRFKMSGEWHQNAVASGRTIEQLALEVAQQETNDMDPVPNAGGPNVQVGDDLNRSTLCVAVGEAILHKITHEEQLPQFDKSGAPVVEAFSPSQVVVDEERGARIVRKIQRKPMSDRGRQLCGMSMKRVAEQYLRGLGVPHVDQLSDRQIGKLLFDERIMAKYGAGPVDPSLPVGLQTHSTSDFPSIYLDAQGKSLRRAYIEAPIRWPLFCRRTTAPDFKDIKRIAFGEAPALAQVDELGEYTMATVGESKETYALVKYGKRFAYSWEMLINDDLDAMSRLPTMFGNAARRKEDELAFAQLTSNPTLNQDATALFHTDHGNLATGGPADPPTVATLNAAAAAMMTQQGVSDDVVVEIEPRFIIAPASLMGTIKALLVSTADPASSNAGAANIWQGQLTPIFSGILDAASTTAWYLAADPMQVDTIEVCFLEGETGPVIEQESTFNVDGRQLKVRHVVAAKATAFQGLYKNEG